MLTIRPEQYAKFEEEAWRDFLRRTSDHLRQDMSDYTMGLSDEQLKKRIESSVKLAGKYGLLDEPDVVCFLDAGLLLNDELFAENPKYAPIRVILQDQELTPDERAEQVLTLAFQQILLN